MRTTPSLVAVLAALCAPCGAQAPTVGISAATSLSFQASSGGQTSQVTVPAGPLAASGGFGTSAPSGVFAADASAGTSWWTAATSHEVLVGLRLACSVASPGSTATVGTQEFVVHFASAVPREVTISILRSSFVPPGAPWPLVAIDRGNDGSIDFPNATSGIESVEVLGPAGLDLRFVLDASLATPGLSETQVSVVVTPSNQLQVVPSVGGCGLSTPDFWAIPTYADSGIDLGCNLIVDPMVFVLGLAAQPVLLPASVPACVLMPSPDLLVLPTPTAFQAIVHLPLPASVRPLSLWAQAVRLAPQGLLSTNALRIQAN